MSTSLIDPRDALAAMACLPVPLLVLDGEGEVLLVNAPFRGLFNPVDRFKPTSRDGVASDGSAAETIFSGVLSGVRKALRQESFVHEFDLSLQDPLSGHMLLRARLDRFGSLSVLSVTPPLADANASQAGRDPLTGLPLRQLFHASLGQLAALSGRHGRMLSVLLADIDGMKTLNERQGRDAGDAALAHFASLLRATLRTSDLAARVGGDEFAVLLPETGAEGANHLARRLRAAVAENVCLHAGLPVHYTVSMGLACLGNCRDETEALGDELVILAEEALARAKRTGGSRLTTLTLTAD